MDEFEILCEAAKNGDVDKVKSLINSGIDVTYFDSNGLTPLMHAAKHGHAAIVKDLLEAGAPWNALSPSNISAGDFAMEAGHQDAFETLLNAGTIKKFILASSLINSNRN
jgi:protein arginine N-methyltransferase 2